MALAAGAPLLVLLIAEGLLRAGGYGYPTAFFIRDQGGRGWIENDRFGHRFAPPQIATAPPVLWLPVKKEPGVVRVFVLGESAAMGVPDSSYGFARLLELMLRRRYPQARFEVVNAAMSGINSHIIRSIARECAAREPDLFILYMGNNEMVGPFSPCDPAAHTASLPLIRASLWMRSLRTGQLLDSLCGREDRDRRIIGASTDFEKCAVPASDPRRQRVYEHFQANLRDICDAAAASGARLLLCGVGVNLRDCPPFVSRHRAGLSEADRAAWEALYGEGIELESRAQFWPAIQRYEKAAALDDEYAELHFRLGRCRLALSQPAEALAALSRARDLDALQFRTDSRLNRIVAEAARQGASRGFVFVDIDQALHQADREGVAGDSLFHEHVHLKFDGAYQVARTLLGAVEPLLAERGVLQSPVGNVPTRDECAATLAFTPYDELRIAQPVAEMLGRPPFTLQTDWARRAAGAAKEVERLLSRFESAVERSGLIYEQAIRDNPADWTLRQNLGMLLFNRKKYAQAVREFDQALSAVPHHAMLRFYLGQCLALSGDSQRALRELRTVARQRPTMPLVRRVLGDVLMHGGQGRLAIAEYEAALQLQPGDQQIRELIAAARSGAGQVPSLEGIGRRPAGTLSEIARKAYDEGNELVRQNRLPEAIARFEAAAAASPDSAQVHTSLGAALAASGELDRALGHFVRAVALDGENHKARMGMAQAMARKGMVRDSLPHYRRALSQNPASAQLTCELAWILATSRDSAIRDSQGALRLAQEGCSLAGYRSAGALDVLAAAQAAAGRFDEAARSAATALELARESRNGALAAAIEDRLALYRQGRAYVADRPTEGQSPLAVPLAAQRGGGHHRRSGEPRQP